MATVVITIDDNNNELTTDVEFNPPLADECSEAQTIALRLINYLGGSRVYADRHRLSVVHYHRTDQPLCAKVPEIAGYSNQ